MTNKEELTFIPFHLKRPNTTAKFTRAKTLSVSVHEFLSFPSFLNYLYSLSEVSYLRSKFPNVDITADSVAKLMIKYGQSPSNRQGVLEELNAMIIKDGNYQKALEIFKSVHLPQVVTSWFQSSLSVIEKCLVLNLLSFCFEYLEIPRGSFGTVWKTVCESAVKSEDTCAKKHLLFLLQIEDYICRFEQLEEPFLRYTFPQTPVISTSFENAMNFKFVLFNQIPNAYICGEQVINGLSKGDKEYLEYVQTGNYNSNSANEDCRAFLITCGSCFPSFVNFLAHIGPTSSRVLNPNPVTRFDLVFKATNSAPSEQCDSFRERDILFLAVWGNVFVTDNLLRNSNFMDAEIFRHFLYIQNSGSTLFTSVFKSFTSADPKKVEVKQTVEENLAYKKPDTKAADVPVLEIALGLALHTTADIIGYSEDLVSKYVTKSTNKDIFLFADKSESRIIKAEAAYALMRFLRFFPIPHTSPTQSKKVVDVRPKIIDFAYNNLEEFELFEKSSNEVKSDIAPKLSGEDHAAQVKAHCAKIKLSIF